MDGEMDLKTDICKIDPVARITALKMLFEKVIRPLGYKFSPDTEIVNFLMAQEVILEAKHGIPYCPCQPLMRDRAYNMKIVCPCIPFHRGHFDLMKRCWCGLFVHEDVTDPDSLPQIPYEEYLERSK